MTKKSSRSGPVIPSVIGAAAAAVGYALFRDNRKSMGGENYEDSRKGNLSKSSKPKKATRFSRNRKKGRPSGTGSQTIRIKKMLLIVNEKKEFSLSQIRYRFPSVTERTLRRDLDKLERDGKVIKKGNTRSTIYLKP